MSDYAKSYAAAKDRLKAVFGSDDSLRLTYLASCTVKLEQLSAAIIAGEDVSVSELMALRSMIEEMTPMPEHTVKIEFVGGKNDHVCRACGVEHCIEPMCTKCGFRQHGDLQRWREQRATGGSPTPGAQAGAARPDVRPPAAPAANNVVPMAKPKPRFQEPELLNGACCFVLSGPSHDSMWSDPDPMKRR